MDIGAASTGGIPSSKTVGYSRRSRPSGGRLPRSWRNTEPSAPHDGVLILEAPNDEVAASILLALGTAGNVRTATLRAFPWADVQGLIESPSE